MAKKMKQTSNKYLRQLVRNHEIELRRPRGLKMFDALIKSAPSNMPRTTIFCSYKIWNEAQMITKYKGLNVVPVAGYGNLINCCLTDQEL